MSGPALLDVNVLVALFDPNHVHHDVAHDWFADRQGRAWATCPFTENRFVRVLASPAYPGREPRADALVDRLRRFCSSPHHRFWPDAVSLTDRAVFNPAFLRGRRQVADIYLLGLAKSMGGRLATFDRTIPWKAVVGGRADTLEIISASDANETRLLN